MKRSYSSAVFLLTLLGFALRLYYLTTTHPFFDEYTTVLAAREILRRGWPVLPSGLFYEHGLLSTYLIAPFTALFIDMPLAVWQPAHWGLMLSRWPSLLIGTATIPLIYTLGRRSFNLTSSPPLSSPICLLAAGLFAFSPEGVVWGGRARMYALATLLVLLAVYWAYRGAFYPAPARYRWLAWLALLLALLTQLGVLTLLPPLIVGMVVVGWFSATGRRVMVRVSGVTLKLPDAWFLRPAVLWEGLAVAVIVGVAIYVKRLGQPMGLAPVNAPGSGFVLTEMLKTVAYQTTFQLNWADTIKFLSREFGVPHHFWLAVMAVGGGIVNLAIWLWRQIRNNKLENKSRIEKQSSSIAWLFSNFYFLISLVFGLILLEMVVFLDPFRHNPRYLVMYLPLFYLIAAGAIFSILVQVSRFTFISDILRSNPFGILGAQIRNTQYAIRLFPTLVAIILLAIFTTISWPDLRLALLTPEPAYEEALAFVRTEWQPGDVLLTMNTSAAALYLGRADGFTLQNDADQFLLTTGAGQVDRWLGVPWLATAADFNAALNANPRAWFVIDTIRLPVYFRGDWLALVNNQMEQVWAKDNALVYLTRPNRIPLPSQPETPVKATLGNSIELTGYTLAKINQNLRLTLFWWPLVVPPADYTTFVHLRNSHGDTVSQRDSQPLDGVYPTSRWQPGETVIDPLTLSLPADLPAGTYTLVIGLYQLDTMQRLSVANDTSGENAIVLGEVKLP